MNNQIIKPNAASFTRDCRKIEYEERDRDGKGRTAYYDRDAEKNIFFYRHGGRAHQGISCDHSVSEGRESMPFDCIWSK